MANCGDQSCNCLVRVGEGLSIEGAGTATDPYMIRMTGDLEGNLQVYDTATVNLTLLGRGTLIDPYVLSAVATIALTQLSDVNDPQGGPIVGDVPVWVGTGPAGHWEFQPPPANPAGAVNVSTGISGDGTLGSPLRVRLVGTSAGGTTSGLEVYADSAGNLRTAPPVATSVEWSTIIGKPTTFPTTPSDFVGILPVSKGGTGQSNLTNVTVGNALKVNGRDIYVQSSTPSGATTNDLWFY
jgi:hypothetical protein